MLRPSHAYDPSLLFPYSHPSKLLNTTPNPRTCTPPCPRLAHPHRNHEAVRPLAWEPCMPPLPASSCTGYVRACTSHQWRQRLLDVARPLPPAPATRAPAPAAMAAAPSERHQTAATAPLFPAPPLLLFSPRRHGSPLHRAAGGVFAGGEAIGEEKLCP